MRRIKPALAKASSSFPMLVVEEEAWSGDRMTFRVRALGQVASGGIDVADDHVRLEVTLPWLLHKFAQSCSTPSQAVVAFCLRKNSWAARSAGRPAIAGFSGLHGQRDALGRKHPIMVKTGSTAS